MNSKKYIENVLKNWSEFCKGHKRFEEALKNLITENIQLKEENQALKCKLEYLENFYYESQIEG